MHEQNQTRRTNNRWYAVHCKSLNERQAAAALEKLLGLRVYLPEVNRRFRGTMQPTPFFPRYLFVHADLEQVPPSMINTTPGVVRLVTVGNTPQPVPARVLAAIQNGLEQIDAQGGLPAHNLQPGDTVELRGGPLRGLEAVFVGPMTPSDRVRVLVEFLGQQREVEVDVDMLEGNDHPRAKRERRTRGRGRPIKHG